MNEIASSPASPASSPRLACDSSRLIVFLAYPEMGLLDLTGAQTVFWAASKYMNARNLPGYTLHTASLAGGLMHTAEGLAVNTVALSDFDARTIDTLIAPGAPNILQAMNHSLDLVAWLAEASGKAKRTASVCSGTFLLAEAGLLEGRRAATHWLMCDMLKERYPAIEVDSDAIFVKQDAIWTSAGVSAGIDLALALVEEDCGREVALLVAREMVVFLKRPGGQAQYSQLLKSQTSESAAFDELHLWISHNLATENLTVETLAQQVQMSPRNFARVYKLKTGRTPAKAVEVLRVEAARRLLEESERNIDQISRLCGFGDEERMRLTFQRNLGVSPREYRSRFSR
ncbi:helix-turn-helix domain-containing protein [Pseudomonas sp. C1C7]|uniref:GlxA family transcriptional regulator n=1 Tax=Pseudomonas sp. C1C7 TaxID=2735272 RepID=UPI0015861C5A|nr:helix-turn-helix domain-containing protein [Pseudomonas sp. C1C7]